jgi:HK97 family phage major capsid protein
MDKVKMQAEFRAVEAKAKPLAAKDDLTEAEGAELEGYIGQMEGLKRKIDMEDRAQAAFSAAPAPDRVEVVQDSADIPFSGLGEFLQAIARSKLPAGERLGGKPCGVMDRRLLPRAAASGMNESVPSDGGFAVDTQWSDQLIQKAHETGKLPGLCNKVPIGAGKNGLRCPTLDETSRATGSRLGGVRVYRKNEATAPTAAKLKWGRLEIDLEDMIGLAYASNDLLEDYSALGAIVGKAFADEFGFKMDDEIINGTGAGQMLGILASGALVSAAKETGQTADTVNAKNINKMWARLWNPARDKAVWLVNQELISQLVELNLPVGTGGSLVYMPAGGLSGRAYDTLMGRPVMYIEQAAAPGDLGDIILADFSEYIIIDKGGVQAAQSMHVNFTTNEMAFRFVYRINGQPAWDVPLTPYKATSGVTVSPFIGLAARA